MDFFPAPNCWLLHALYRRVDMFQGKSDVTKTSCRLLLLLLQSGRRSLIQSKHALKSNPYPSTRWKRCLKAQHNHTPTQKCHGQSVLTKPPIQSDAAELLHCSPNSKWERGKAIKSPWLSIAIRERQNKSWAASQISASSLNALSLSFFFTPQINFKSLDLAI